MASRLVLHIGTQKSGTTYLQRVLAHLSAELSDAGVLYPTRIGGRGPVYNHEAAAYGLLGTESFPWVSPARATAQESVWSRLVEQVQQWPGPVVVSGEALSVVNADAARRLVEALAVTPTDIIITARDLGRVIPSSWQQHIRNGRSTTFSAYLRQLSQRRGASAGESTNAEWELDPDQTFWRAYAIGSLVNRWSPLARSVTVVPVPRGGADPHELWQRFATSLELGHVLPHIPPHIDSIGANVGITEPEALVLAGLNRQSRNSSLTDPALRQLRGRIVKDAFVPRADRGNPVRLPPAWLDQVRAWADADVNDLMRTDAKVVGPVEDLRVDASLRAGVSTPPQQVASAAGAALYLLNQPPPAEAPAAPTRKKRRGPRSG
ncbi:MAG: hypothetical protein WAO40_06660 [Candidatus Nanopelagicales bacterium]